MPGDPGNYVTPALLHHSASFLSVALGTSPELRRISRIIGTFGGFAAQLSHNTPQGRHCRPRGGDCEGEAQARFRWHFRRFSTTLQYRTTADMAYDPPISFGWRPRPRMDGSGKPSRRFRPDHLRGCDDPVHCHPPARPPPLAYAEEDREIPNAFALLSARADGHLTFLERANSPIQCAPHRRAQLDSQPQRVSPYAHLSSVSPGPGRDAVR
jgi:hypothetical protein